MLRLLLFLLLPFGLQCVEFSHLRQTLDTVQFPYDLKVKLLKGKSEEQNVLLLLHGMGSDNRLGEILQSYGDIPDHLVSFNFPHAGLQAVYDPTRSSFGTIQEILPVLYLLKKLVVEGGLPSSSLYGFSAGGGALINTISVLNMNRYDQNLQDMGISRNDKQTILKALQQGTLLLDAPLKSMREILQTRGHSPWLDRVGSRYNQNGFEPIDALQNWSGLSFHVLVYFEVPDEVLSNRDDALFIDRLKRYNAGKVQALSGRNGGHATYHKELWKAYLLR
ncbi:MAG: hypothetical protein LLG04_10265 [Parachlamydia sp.]|nr:hypothetical protein [Parachlamydia sp.]